jgi:hypothetical protein
VVTVVTGECVTTVTTGDTTISKFGSHFHCAKFLVGTTRTVSLPENRQPALKQLPNWY